MFIRKCNLIVDYFEENMLALNLSKSKYLIINGKEFDFKSDIIMKNGILPYKPVVKYLGILISDTGNIKTDVGLYIDEKHYKVEKCRIWQISSYSDKIRQKKYRYTTNYFVKYRSYFIHEQT